MRQMWTGVTLAAVLATGLVSPARAAEDIKVDNKLIELYFKINKQKYDPDKKEYTWVLETKERVANGLYYSAQLLDADGAPIGDVKTIEFTPLVNTGSLPAGMIFKAVLKFPKDADKVKGIKVREAGH